MEKYVFLQRLVLNELAESMNIGSLDNLIEEDIYENLIKKDIKEIEFQLNDILLSKNMSNEKRRDIKISILNKLELYKSIIKFLFDDEQIISVDIYCSHNEIKFKKNLLNNSILHSCNKNENKEIYNYLINKLFFIEDFHNLEVFSYAIRVITNDNIMIVKIIKRQPISLENFVEVKVKNVDEFSKVNFLSEEMLDFLIKNSNKNIVFSGTTGSGKSTFLSSFLTLCKDRKVRYVNMMDELIITSTIDVFLNHNQKELMVINGTSKFKESINYLDGNKQYFLETFGRTAKDTMNYLIESYREFNNITYDLDSKTDKNFSNYLSSFDLIITTMKLSNGRRVISRISQFIGYGEEGKKRNNSLVEKFNLDKKFIMKNSSKDNLYVQDIFRYDVNNDEFYFTGWKID